MSDELKTALRAVRDRRVELELATGAHGRAIHTISVITLQLRTAHNESDACCADECTRREALERAESAALDLSLEQDEKERRCHR